MRLNEWLAKVSCVFASIPTNMPCFFLFVSIFCTLDGVQVFRILNPKV